MLEEPDEGAVQVEGQLATDRAIQGAEAAEVLVLRDREHADRGVEGEAEPQHRRANLPLLRDRHADAVALHHARPALEDSRHSLRADGGDHDVVGVDLGREEPLLRAPRLTLQLEPTIEPSAALRLRDGVEERPLQALDFELEAPDQRPREALGGVGRSGVAEVQHILRQERRWIVRLVEGRPEEADLPHLAGGEANLVEEVREVVGPRHNVVAALDAAFAQDGIVLHLVDDERLDLLEPPVVEHAVPAWVLR